MHIQMHDESICNCIHIQAYNLFCFIIIKYKMIMNGIAYRMEKNVLYLTNETSCVSLHQKPLALSPGLVKIGSS